LVYGCPTEKKGVINLSLARTKKGKIVAVKYLDKIKLEKKAITKYELIKKSENYSLLEIEPLTGRTNQIRVHLKAINCPLVGEPGIKKRLRRNFLNRIFLHAYYLAFYDLPRSGLWREFKIGLPKKLKDFLETL